MGWDGVELNETNKDITGLSEREHDKNDVRKYVKYLVGMNIGEKANIIVTSTQLLEVESIWSDTEKLMGRVIDVHALDALYLN